LTDKRLFVKNNIFVFSNKIFSKLLTFGIMVFLTRQMNKESFGELTILIMLSNIFNILQDFGSSFVIVREIAQRNIPSKQILANTLLLKICTGVVAFLAFVTFARFMNYNSTVIELSYLFAFGMVLQSLLLSIIKFFEGKEQMKYSSFVIVSERILIAILLISFSYYFNYIKSFGQAFLLSNCITLVFSLIIIFRKSNIMFFFDKAIIKKIIYSAKYFLIFTIVAAFYNRFDIFYLSAKFDNSFVATYRASTQIIESIYFIPLNMSISFLPFFSRLFSKEKFVLRGIYSKINKQFLLLALFICITIFIKSDAILSILYNKYSESFLMFSILSLAIPFYFINSLNGNLLIAMGKEKIVTTSMVISSIIKITLLILFIQKFGLIAIASIAAFSESIAFLIQYISIKKTGFKVTYTKKDLVLFSSLIFYGILLFVSTNLILNIVLFLCTGIIISKEIILLIRDTLKKKLVQ